MIRETFYEEHDSETKTDRYGNRIWHDDGRVETRYDEYKNFEKYDEEKERGDYKTPHLRNFTKSNNESGGHGENYKKKY